MVTHICNLSYLGGGYQKDCSLRLTLSKVSNTPISINKRNVVGHNCSPSYMGDEGSWSEAGLDKKHNTLPEK
jgi:hypothetical protein